MKSNRAVGNGFETELCELLFGYGFWSHNLKQDSSGQPADVITVKNKVAYLIDCKVCSTDKGFDLRRVEDNQELAMEMWEECGNGQGWFALKVNEDVFMLPYFTVKAYKAAQSYMSIAEIYEVAKPLERWVKRCR